MPHFFLILLCKRLAIMLNSEILHREDTIMQKMPDKNVFDSISTMIPKTHSLLKLVPVSPAMKIILGAKKFMAVPLVSCFSSLAEYRSTGIVLWQTQMFMFLFQNFLTNNFLFPIFNISSNSMVFKTSGPANRSSFRQPSKFLAGKKVVALFQFLQHYINYTLRKRDFARPTCRGQFGTFET